MAYNANPGMTSEVARSYNSFSGSDIRAMIGPYTFAEMQAVSYGITREKAPVYTMGSADPRAFSRNKRGIAGSLVWINFDRHALLNLIYQAGGQFVANTDDLRPQYTPGDSAIGASQVAIFTSTLVRDNGLGSGRTIDALDTGGQGAVASNKSVARPWYSDQILPFDITLQGVNEVGAATGMKLYGVEILNEGTGVSIDDAVQEMNASFVARTLEPWSVVPSVSNEFQNIILQS
jgi:hypothetical protein